VRPSPAFPPVLLLAALTLGPASVACSSDGGDDPGTGGNGGAAGSVNFPGAGGASSGNQGGSGSAPPSGELEVIPGMFVVEDSPLSPIHEGDSIDLTLPPQGGHVLLVGAQVRNLATDTIELRTRIRDMDTDTIVAEEGRTVVMVKVPGDPTLSQPELRSRSQVNHVPVCPNYGDKDVVGRAHKLEVRVRELYVDVPRSATGTRTVTPSCANNADVAECVCECSAGFVLGKCVPQSQGLP
jgi:hypothetical protein